MSLRVALFCSHYRGLAMLDAALSLQSQFQEVVLCGLATDDPSKPWTSSQKRIWKYPYTHEEMTMVANNAKVGGVPVWLNSIKSQDFFDEYFDRWKPDVCYMGVFGQKVPEPVWSYPLFGFRHNRQKGVGGFAVSF